MSNGPLPRELMEHLEAAVEEFATKAEAICEEHLSRVYPQFHASVRLKISITPFVSLESKNHE